MLNKSERGSLLLPLILVVTLLFCSLGFAFWAFAGRQDYKNNVDEKIAEAVEASNQQLEIEKDAEFAEKEKSPNDIYVGPSALGSLTLTYPKTWSVYVDENGNNATPLNGYMHPKYVPSVNSKEVNYAFRYEVVNSTYDKELAKFAAKVRSGTVSVAAYRAPKVPDALGSKIVGEIEVNKQGTIVLLPLRDKTIKVWTEGQEFIADYNAILEKLTFVP